MKNVRYIQNKLSNDNVKYDKNDFVDYRFKVKNDNKDIDEYKDNFRKSELESINPNNDNMRLSFIQVTNDPNKGELFDLLSKSESLLNDYHDNMRFREGKNMSKKDNNNYDNGNID